MQQNLVAMAPNGLIYVPADGGLYSSDYSSAGPRIKHVFMHEMCHVMQYQLGMAVFLRGMVSGLISYKYDIDFNSAAQKSFLIFRMEQQASIFADYWLLLNDGVSNDWLIVKRLRNYSGQSARVLIPLYESILKEFLSARSSSRAAFALYAK